MIQERKKTKHSNHLIPTIVVDRFVLVVVAGCYYYYTTERVNESFSLARYVCSMPMHIQNERLEMLQMKRSKKKEMKNHFLPF